MSIESKASLNTPSFDNRTEIGNLALAGSLSRERPRGSYEFDESNSDDLLIKLEMLEQIPILKELRSEVGRYENLKQRDKLRQEKAVEGIDDFLTYVEHIKRVVTNGHLPLIEQTSEVQAMRQAGYSEADVDKHKKGFNVDFRRKYNGDKGSYWDRMRLKEIDRVNGLLSDSKDAPQQIDMGF